MWGFFTKSLAAKSKSGWRSTLTRLLSDVLVLDENDMHSVPLSVVLFRVEPVTGDPYYVTPKTLNPETWSSPYSDMRIPQSLGAPLYRVLQWRIYILGVYELYSTVLVPPLSPIESPTSPAPQEFRLRFI